MYVDVKILPKINSQPVCLKWWDNTANYTFPLSLDVAAPVQTPQHPAGAAKVVSGIFSHHIKYRNDRTPKSRPNPGKTVKHYLIGQSGLVHRRSIGKHSKPLGQKLKKQMLKVIQSQKTHKETAVMLTRRSGTQGAGEHSLNIEGLMREQDTGVYNSKAGKTWQELKRTTTRLWKRIPTLSQSGSLKAEYGSCNFHEDFTPVLRKDCIFTIRSKMQVR